MNTDSVKLSAQYQSGRWLEKNEYYYSQKLINSVANIYKMIDFYNIIILLNYHRSVFQGGKENETKGKKNIR